MRIFKRVDDMRADKKLDAAHSALKAKDYPAAILHAKETLALDPAAHKAHHVIAVSSRNQGDLEEAMISIEAALDIAPREAEYLNTYGSLLMPFSRDFDAITAFRTALEIAPNYIDPAISLAQLYLQRKNPIQAADVLQTSLGHNPDHPTLVKGLMIALKDAHQFEIAETLAAKLPASADTVLARGDIARARRQKPVAEAHYIQALSFPPTSRAAFRNLIHLRWADKDGGETGAAGLINKFVTDNPEAGAFYLYGAELLSEMDRVDDALNLIDRAEAKFGEIPDTLFLRSKVLIDAGLGAQGFNYADRALKARPGDLSSMVQLARGALIVGEAKLALEAAQSGQMRQPKNLFWLAAGATAFRALGRDEDYNRLCDYSRVKAYDIAPPAEYDTQEAFLSQLKEALMKRHKQQAFPLGRSLRGGTQTSSDLRFADDRVVQDFFQALSEPMNDYITSMPQEEMHPVFGRRRNNFRFSNAWSVHLQGEGFHVNHLHPEGWISSAFYVDVPKDTAARKDKAGWIAFGKPPFTVLGTNGKPLGAEHMVAPKAGQLLLFPSHMWHGTVPLPEGDKTSSLTMSFDAVPA